MTIASDALKQKTDLIMKRFEERARDEVISTHGTTSLAIRDALPKHLNQLVAALASADKQTTAEIAKRTVSKEGVGKEHGRDRATSHGYSIEELIFEYRILRQVVMRTLEEEIILSATEREIITDLVEQAVNDAACEFSNAQREVSEQFTAILSHDLRTPMTAAKISAELILRDSLSTDTVRKSASRIMEAVRRMDCMIKELLDAGRMRAGQLLEVKFADCSPFAVAAEVIEQMTIIHGNRFVLSAEESIRAAWNADLYRRALENLIGNAVKYGDSESKITVTISKENILIVTAVHNEGKTIPESEQPFLFEKYRRARSAESGEKNGWGLGLTLVLGAVQAHHGTILVESAEGKGTTFIMSMPVEPDAAPAA